MKSVAATEAKNRLGAILDEAQREPIVIRRQDRDIAVVMSMAEYERLRAGNIQALLMAGFAGAGSVDTSTVMAGFRAPSPGRIIRP